MSRLMLSFFLALAIVSAHARVSGVESREWLDIEGHHINCHGGCIITGSDSLYYWYGENRENGAPQLGVACYTSPDLVHWTNRGIVMTIGDSIIPAGSTIERPKVVYNALTDRYVMWMHHEMPGQGYSAAHSAVAVADNPLGPFVPLRSGRVNPGRLPANMPPEADTASFDLGQKWWTPRWSEQVAEGMFILRDRDGGQMARDMTIYVDNDSTAYHIYSSEDNLTLHIAELTPDYLAHTGRYVRLFPGGHNEAPVIFKHDGIYWMITSGCTGWAPNAARLMRAESIMGPWEQLTNPCRGHGADTTFGGQGTYALSLADGTIIFMADIWHPDALSSSGHLWIPIEFDATSNCPYLEAVQGE
ncbi:MAG: glycoside hydrolase family 43 protein [Pseudoflavonifractor sp.]|nr:glycoside hydrolase family 43 protein [Alloprevotella sp.]MCM1117605.1 glycoside hydrolase family 43 protein [Pseudoflavonifractor sp.]